MIANPQVEIRNIFLETSLPDKKAAENSQKVNGLSAIKYKIKFTKIETMRLNLYEI
jgi:hypothetical protein